MLDMKKFIEIILELWHTIQKPIAVILLICVFVFSAFDFKIAQFSAGFAVALIILNLLLEIHNNITESKKDKSFIRFHDAAIHWRQTIENLADHNKKIHLRWLGLTMDYGAPILDDLLQDLSRKNKILDVELEIVMLNPTWEGLDKINDTWKSKAPTSLQILKLAVRRASKTNSKIKASIYLYDHMPNWHGFSINDRFFYISRCSVVDGQMLGGENPYILFDAPKNKYSEIEGKHFIGWFEFCKKNKVDLLI